MGSPASPVIANLFMTKLEGKAIMSYDGQKPKIWYRFVNDVLSIVGVDEVEKLLGHISNQHANINFIVECEENKQMPFMDLRIYRSKDLLLFDVFCKQTHTGRYLQFSSHHPDSAKRAVMTALYKRIDYINKGTAARKKEELIFSELSANGSPKSLSKKPGKVRISTQTHQTGDQWRSNNHRNCNHSVHRRDQSTDRKGPQ